MILIKQLSQDENSLIRMNIAKYIKLLKIDDTKNFKNEIDNIILELIEDKNYIVRKELFLSLIELNNHIDNFNLIVKFLEIDSYKNKYNFLYYFELLYNLKNKSEKYLIDYLFDINLYDDKILIKLYFKNLYIIRNLKEYNKKIYSIIHKFLGDENYKKYAVDCLFKIFSLNENQNSNKENNQIILKISKENNKKIKLMILNIEYNLLKIIPFKNYGDLTIPIGNDLIIIDKYKFKATITNYLGNISMEFKDHFLKKYNLLEFFYNLLETKYFKTKVFIISKFPDYIKFFENFFKEYIFPLIKKYNDSNDDDKLILIIIITDKILDFGNLNEINILNIFFNKNFVNKNDNIKNESDQLIKKIVDKISKLESK